MFSKTLDVLIKVDNHNKSLDRMVVISDWQLYFSVQSLMAHCVNNAEFINNRIRKYLLKHTTSEDERKIIITSDFMTLKDAMFKTNKMLQIREFGLYSDSSLKNIRRDMQNFVEDRNVYTHGRLVLLLSENKLLIEHRKGYEMIYSEINLQVLKSYNSLYPTFSILLDTLEILDIVQEFSGKEDLATAIQPYLHSWNLKNTEAVFSKLKLYFD